MASVERVKMNVFTTDSKTSSAELNNFKLCYHRLNVLLFSKALSDKKNTKNRGGH